MVETQVPGIQASLSAVVKKTRGSNVYLMWRNFDAEKIWCKWRKMKFLYAKVTKLQAKSIKRLKNLLCAKLNPHQNFSTYGSV